MTTPAIHGGGVLGEKITTPRRQLDTFDLQKRVERVTYTSDEVSSLCPITGQPDWYEVEITLSNPTLGIESKSLKLYLQSFRQDGMFCEAFADLICKDVWRSCSTGKVEHAPFAVEVDVRQKPRGGVSIHASAIQDRPMSDKEQ